MPDESSRAPEPVGAFPHAKRVGNLLFLSGIGPRTALAVLSVAGKEVRDLASFFRRIWAQGQAGVEVPLTIYRDGDTMDFRLKSSERNRFLKGPSLH